MGNCCSGKSIDAQSFGDSPIKRDGMGNYQGIGKQIHSFQYYYYACILKIIFFLLEILRNLVKKTIILRKRMERLYEDTTEFRQ